MLFIKVETVPEKWDEEKQEFIEPEYTTLCLEHSLVSISKWESKWNKAFLGKQEKTDEEVLDYVKCMTISKNVDSSVYDYLSEENINEIDKYIKAPMTASNLRNIPGSADSKDVVTSELIYYWMICAGIPFECEKWHLNRLMSLIRVCGAKNAPSKVGKRDMAISNSELNRRRREKCKTNG